MLFEAANRNGRVHRLDLRKDICNQVLALD